MVMKWFIEEVLLKIDISLNFILKTRFKFSLLVLLFLLVQSPSNKLQNETNPTSVALSFGNGSLMKRKGSWKHSKIQLFWYFTSVLPWYIFPPISICAGAVFCLSPPQRKQVARFHLNLACSLVTTINIDLPEDIFEFSFWIQGNTPKVRKRNSKFCPNRSNAIGGRNLHDKFG